MNTTTKTPSQLAEEARQTAHDAIDTTRAYAQNAVNAAGDLYAVGRGPGPLVRIDGESLVVDRWEVPDGESPYGIAVDATGDVWMGDWNGGLLHFAPANETFTVIDTPNSAWNAP